MKTYVLFNPYAGKKETFDASIEKLKGYLEGKETEFLDITKIDDYSKLFASLSEQDEICVCGGDGTLSRFANSIADSDVKNDILYYANGTGNDFLRDLGKERESAPFPINEYITNLPIAEVKGKTYRFLNNVGFGIDGYCCEVGDKMREAGKTDINYTSIAIKGLLFGFKPANATVIVDGKEYSYKKVWIAPTMNGRFYGGGMMPNPEQKRIGEEREISVMIWHGSGKLSTLMAFPSLFKGEHIKHTKMIAIHSGRSITVRFDAPKAVQIDGETIKDVSEYTATLGN